MTHSVVTLLIVVVVFVLVAQNTALWRTSSTANNHTISALARDGEPTNGQADQAPISTNTRDWYYIPDSHAENFALNAQQCEIAFPGLWYEIDRSVAFWQTELSRRITTNDTSLDLQNNGVFRALIHNNQLRILETKGIFGLDASQLPERAVAVWHQIHRALLGATAAGEMLPSIEFSASVDDIPTTLETDAGETSALWAFARKYNARAHEGMFLIPDFNYWSWRGVAGPFSELRAHSKEVDGPVLDKISKLVWRGAVWTNPEVRGALVKATKAKPWADVSDFDWSTRSNYIPMEDFCYYAFLAHTEGRSWSGRLKYLLNCKSVTMIHEREWTAHYYHLLKPEGPDQNFVPVKRDFSDLEAKVLYLLDNREAAQHIADNAVTTFRDRYLTLAAEACYWRKLIRSWSQVADSPLIHEYTQTNLSGTMRMKRKLRGIAFEELVVFRGRAEWPPVAKEPDPKSMRA